MVDKEILFWLWLKDCLGIENKKVKSVFESFDSAMQIYLSDESELRLSGIFSEKELDKLKNKNLDKAKKVYNDCKNFGYDIFAYTDDSYPKMLKEIAAPPVVLYVSGKLPDENMLRTAVVGTRSATSQGRKKAFEFGYELARNNVVVVSGGADGIDIQAHKGALQAGGKTVCVIGCGINYNYPKSSADVRRQITRYGAIVSEYPPYYSPSKYTFPKRNRIISGMSHCTLVVEAGEKSGSLITAKYAGEQKRTVFAVSGSADGFGSQGAERLIREGAKPAADFRDIIRQYRPDETSEQMKSKVEMLLEHYFGESEQVTKKSRPKKAKNVKVHTFQYEILNSYYSEPKRISEPQKESESKKNTYKKPPENKNNQENLKKIAGEQLTGNAAAVYDTISDIPVHVDEIKAKTGLDVGELLMTLTELEMSGYISSLSGRRYVIGSHSKT